jgi:hypothetical protein
MTTRSELRWAMVIIGLAVTIAAAVIAFTAEVLSP